MKIRTFLLSTAVVVVTNGGLLALVALNQSGGAEATVELTERELRILPGDSENTRVTLSLAWRRPFDGRRPGGPEYAWFDQARLEALGFDCRVALADPSAERFYRSQSMLLRPAFAVLEFGGDAWKETADREVQQAGQTLPQAGSVTYESPAASQARRERLLARRSRLVVVDVGKSAAELRNHHPDRSRFIVTKALVRLVFVASSGNPAGGAPRITGTVAEILPAEISVPRELRSSGDVLSTKPPSGEWPTQPLGHDPRYRVTITYGKRLEPRVVKVQAGL
jgi:hypothetical protein